MPVIVSKFFRFPAARLWRRAGAPLALWLLALPLTGLLARMPESVSGEAPRDYFQFLFLYDHTTTPGQEERMFHPFYSLYENAERAYSLRTVVYPIYYSHGTDYWKFWSVLYLFTGESRYHETEKEDNDIALAPLFFWGTGDSQKERYFGFYPFYGHLKDKLAHSEITFLLFPVVPIFPLYASWSYGDYRARAILWPIVTWGGDGQRRKDFRFLPFYSSKVHEGKYDHKTVLWPFFQWGAEDQDKKDPRHYVSFFPFFSRKWSQSGDMQATSILWPITLFAWGKDEKRKAREVRALWFLYQDIEGESPFIRKFMVFPFYAHYQMGNNEQTYYNEMTFYLLLIGSLRTNSSIVQSRYDFFIPFFYRHYRYYPMERDEISSWKIWPLASGYSAADGSAGWRVLALWPLPDDQFERIWGPWYSLAEWRREANGDRYFSLFFRLFSVYWGNDATRIFFAGFHYTQSPYLFEVGFLGGLIGYSRETRLADGTPLRFYPGLYRDGRPAEAGDHRYVHLFWMRW